MDPVSSKSVSDVLGILRAWSAHLAPVTLYIRSDMAASGSSAESDAADGATCCCCCRTHMSLWSAPTALAGECGCVASALGRASRMCAACCGGLKQRDLSQECSMESSDQVSRVRIALSWRKLCLCGALFLNITGSVGGHAAQQHISCVSSMSDRSRTA